MNNKKITALGDKVSDTDAVSFCQATGLIIIRLDPVLIIYEEK